MTHYHNSTTMLTWCRTKLAGSDESTVTVEHVNCVACLRDFVDLRRAETNRALQVLDVLTEGRL